MNRDFAFVLLVLGLVLGIQQPARAQIVGGGSSLTIGTTQVGFTRPSAALGATIAAAGTAWSYGSWVTVMSNSDQTATTAITGIAVFSDGVTGMNANTHCDMQIGTGSTPTVVSTFPWFYSRDTSAGQRGFPMFILFPPVQVAGSTQIQMRAQCSAANATMWAKLYLVPIPF